MFRQFSGQKEPHGGLNLSAADRPAFVVVSQTRRFGGDSLENVIHETVHDRHRFAAHTGIGMNLFKDLVNVNVVGHIGF